MIIVVGKSVLGRLFLTGTCDFGTIEWASVTISGERNPVFPDSAQNVQDAISINKQHSVHNKVDITGLSLGMVQLQDSV